MYHGFIFKTTGILSILPLSTFFVWQRCWQVALDCWQILRTSVCFVSETGGDRVVIFKGHFP